MAHENKHTPAPWYYQESDYREDIVASEATGQTIARCNSYADNGFKVNAHLIAAAPELLEALQNAFDIVRQHNLLSTATLQERLDTIERLIDWQNSIVPLVAKAKGEA